MKRILAAAAKLPPSQARRVVSAIVAAASEPPDQPPADLVAALAEDLRPLGEALHQAFLSDDFPAMQAALKKISARMPDFLATPALESAISRQLLDALLEPPPAATGH